MLSTTYYQHWHAINYLLSALACYQLLTISTDMLSTTYYQHWHAINNLLSALACYQLLTISTGMLSTTYYQHWHAINYLLLVYHVDMFVLPYTSFFRSSFSVLNLMFYLILFCELLLFSFLFTLTPFHFLLQYSEYMMRWGLKLS